MTLTCLSNRRVVRVTTGGFVAAVAFGSVGASVAQAADAADGERGLAPTGVDAAVWTEASADPTVVQAFATYLAAETSATRLQIQARAAQAALRRAARTPVASDDVVAKAMVAVAKRGAQSAAAKAAELKEAWDETIADRIAAIETQHGVAPTSSGGARPSGPVDGTYVGKASHKNPFGDVQVTLTVQGGKVTACSASYPTDSQSGPINTGAVPTLCSEVLASQTAAIGAVGGASYTSPAFKDSLADAIRKAGL